jgi:hypothetical protein
MRCAISFLCLHRAKNADFMPVRWWIVKKCH